MVDWSVIYITTIFHHINSKKKLRINKPLLPLLPLTNKLPFGTNTLGYHYFAILCSKSPCQIDLSKRFREHNGRRGGREGGGGEEGRRRGGGGGGEGRGGEGRRGEGRGGGEEGGAYNDSESGGWGTLWYPALVLVPIIFMRKGNHLCPSMSWAPYKSITRVG
jgi:hypothetical protein